MFEPASDWLKVSFSCSKWCFKCQKPLAQCPKPSYHYQNRIAIVFRSAGSLLHSFHPEDIDGPCLDIELPVRERGRRVWSCWSGWVQERPRKMFIYIVVSTKNQFFLMWSFECFAYLHIFCMLSPEEMFILADLAFLCLNGCMYAQQQARLIGLARRLLIFTVTKRLCHKEQLQRSILTDSASSKNAFSKHVDVTYNLVIPIPGSDRDWCDARAPISRCSPGLVFWRRKCVLFLSHPSMGVSVWYCFPLLPRCGFGEATEEVSFDLLTIGASTLKTSKALQAFHRMPRRWFKPYPRDYRPFVQNKEFLVIRFYFEFIYVIHDC